MNQDKKVLAALDLSPSSIEVLKVAVQLVSWLQGSLVIGNVINKREIDILKNIRNVNSLNKKDMETIKKVWQIGPLKNEYDLESEHNTSKGDAPELDCVDYLRQERKKMIYHMLREIEAPDLDVEISFAKGNPFKELLKMVNNNSIDIVVIGSKVKGTLNNTLLGSIPERMFRHCSAQVLSVRVQKFSYQKFTEIRDGANSFPTRICKNKGSEEKKETIFLPQEPFENMVS